MREAIVIMSHDCCLSYPATPLTRDNVLEAVKTVMWRGLGTELGLLHSKLSAIQRQHISGEARLKAVVEAFLLGEGYQPSWRRLIHSLHKAGESQLAEKIKINAEPHQGEWVYVGWGMCDVCERKSRML